MTKAFFLSGSVGGGALLPDPDAALYFDARPSLSPGEKSSINAAVSALKSAGIWDSLDQIGLLAFGDFSDLFAGALKGPTPTNNGFALEDFTAMGAAPGILGDGSSYLDTNVSNDSRTLNNSSLVVLVTSGSTDTQQAEVVWGRDAAPTLGIFARYVTATYSFAGTAGAIRNSQTGRGLWISSRTSSTQLDLYNNGEPFADSTDTNSGSLQPGETGVVFAIRNNGSLTAFSQKRLMLWAVGSALTSEQAEALAVILQTLRTTLTPFVGPFLFPFFESNEVEQLRLAQSSDGINFTLMGTEFFPSFGTCRDPNPWLDGNTLHVAYTTGSFGTSSSFGVASGLLSSGRLVTVKNVDCSAVPGVTQVWGAKWFTDELGRRCIVVAISSDGTDGPFLHYWVRPLDENNLAGDWTSPTLITGSGIPTNSIDGFIFTRSEDPGAWYMIYKDEDEGAKQLEILRSTTSATSGYEMWRDAAALGMDSGIEGCSVVALGAGVCRIYFDRYSNMTGMHYADTSTFTAVGSGTPIACDIATRNGGFMKVAA